jgi:hypothetical protein
MLMDVTREDKAHGAGSYGLEKRVYHRQTATRVLPVRDRRIVQTHNNVGPHSSQLVTQLRKCRVRNSPLLMPNPLGIDEGHRPAFRDTNHPHGRCWSEHLSHDRGIVVVTGDDYRCFAFACTPGLGKN